MRRQEPSQAPDGLEAAIAALSDLSLEELRERWKQQRRSPPPACRNRTLLRGLIAWSLQEEAFGGLSGEAARRLARLAGTVARDPAHAPSAKPSFKPGTILTRHWRGVPHQVRATADGFEHQGNLYASLSEVARAITGTRWSGPAFFGLRTAAGARTPKP